ncbi:MAG: MmcQ/YjbR family DNA-binding protein [Actinomycetota bacterium]
MPKRPTTFDRVLAFALSLPEAYEDHPWDETVAKVNGKVFVFFGSGDDEHEPGMSVKLEDSNAQALMVPGAEPTGYGLGRGGWVSVPFIKTSPPVAVLTDWVEESYRIVAPKRISSRLDEPPAEPKREPRKKPGGPSRPKTPRR